MAGGGLFVLGSCASSERSLLVSLSSLCLSLVSLCVSVSLRASLSLSLSLCLSLSPSVSISLSTYCVLVLPPTFLKRTASGAHREKASSMNSGCKTNHCGAVCGVVGGVFAVRVLRLAEAY